MTAQAIKTGQIWREVDPRMTRYVQIQAVEEGSIFIRAVLRGLPSEGWIPAPRTTIRAADPARFNGKRGGYELHAEH